MKDRKQGTVLADFDIGVFQEEYLKIQNCG